MLSVVHPKLWVMNPQHEEDNYHIHLIVFKATFNTPNKRRVLVAKLLLALCFIHMFDL
jgi:hypothetical protein